MLILIVPAGVPMHTQVALLQSVAEATYLPPSLTVYIDPSIRAHLRESMYAAWNLLETKKLFEWNFAPPIEFYRHVGTDQILLADLDLTDGFGILCAASNLEELAKLGDWFNGGGVSADIISNERLLRSYSGRHEGRIGIILCTGPSLLKADPVLLSRYPTIGCNKLFLLDKHYFFRPTYLIVEDRLILEDHARDLHNYLGPEKLYPFDQFCNNSADAYFPLWRSYDPFPRFSADFCDVVYSGWSVAYILLQFAVFLRWRKILLVGLDGHSSPPSASFDGNVAQSIGADYDHFDCEYYGPGKRFHNRSDHNRRR